MSRSWGDTLFGFEGRAGRSTFWLVFGLAVLVLIVFAIIAIVVLETVVGRGAGPALALIIVGAPIVIALYWASLAATIKRLHDRDKSGHWAWLFLGVGSAAGWLALLFDDFSRTSTVAIFALLSLINLGLSVWWLIECGILKGTPGTNQYGEDPLDLDAPSARSDVHPSRPSRPPRPASTVAPRSAFRGEVPPVTEGIAHRLFGFSGRLNRKPFWLTTIAASVAFWILFAILVSVFRFAGQTAARIVAVLLLLGLYWIVAALYSKRLNDRDRPAWLVWPLIVPSFVMVAAAVLLVDETGQFSSSFSLENSFLAIVVSLLALVYVVFYVWIIVEAGFLRGTVGDNRHGPDPLEAAGDARRPARAREA